eukprot:jgi/Psemu1/3830/gm1.3830_g
MYCASKYFEFHIDFKNMDAITKGDRRSPAHICACFANNPGSRLCDEGRGVTGIHGSCHLGHQDNILLQAPCRLENPDSCKSIFISHRECWTCRKVGIPPDSAGIFFCLRETHLLDESQTSGHNDFGDIILLMT